MQDSASNKLRQAFMMTLFAFLSGVAAAASAVVPIFINA